MVMAGLVLVGMGVVSMYKFINKDSLIGVINQSLPPREAGLLAGMLLGDRSGFEKDFWKDLKVSGVVHLVVVSGTNVVLLSSLLIENLAQFLGRKKTIVGVLTLVWGYAGMVGWEPPVIRAVLLVSILYWAQLLGRKFDVWRSLILVVAMMVIADRTMIGGVSFWLSFLAFIGVISQLRINNYELRIKNKYILNMVGNFITTVWVSLWITPVMAMVFGKISLISPFTNLLVMFLAETVFVVGGVGVAAGLIWPFLGEVVLILILPLLKYFVVITEWMGNMKWASFEVKFNWLMLAGWYLILGWFLLRRKGGHAGPPVQKIVGAGPIDAPPQNNVGVDRGVDPKG
jgi:ComEC/Rec2-related protein